MFKKLTVFLFIFVSLSFSQIFDHQPDERNRVYDVQNISIEVRLDLKAKKVEGKVTTLIKSITENLESFKVDAVGMNVKSVKGWIFSATDNQQEALDFEDMRYEYDGQEITIFPGKAIKNGFPYMYEIEYTVINPEKGMYFIGPSETFPDKPYQVWTQGEGEDNRYWFPCYDYPNDMAATEVIVTVDSIYETLSNGRLEKKRRNSDGTITWQWVQEKPHVSYLVMLAVGNWDKIEESWDGIPVISYVPPGKSEWGKRSYRHTVDIIEFFSEYIGYRYPWEKFSQVVVEDFIYGGMENTGAVVLFSGSVYDEFTEPDYDATGLVAHEIAHHWWGNVVTCRNWSEIWLNESFATYFQALYFEYLYGKDEFDYGIYRNGQGAIWTDSAVSRKPVYSNEGHSANTYGKGSVVLNMLRYLIGDDNFRNFINAYIVRNEHKPVSTGDLIDALHYVMDGQNKITQKMPASWKWFFDEWIYRAGQPEYKVKYEYNNNELIVEVHQIQRLDSSSVFRTPVPVTIITSTGKQDILLESSEKTSVHKFKLSSKPLSVIFNKGNKVLCKLYFSKPKSDWLYQLKNSPDAIDRITAITGLKDFLNDDEIINALFETARNDKFWGVRTEAVQTLGKSDKILNNERYIEYFEKENDSRVRRAYINFLGNIFENKRTLLKRPEIWESFLKNIIETEESYYTVADAITALSKLLPPERIYETIITYINRDSHTDIIRRSVIQALDRSNSPEVLKVLLKYGDMGSTARVRNTAISLLRKYLNNSEVERFLINKIKENTRSTQRIILDLIEESGNQIYKNVLNELISVSKDKHFRKKVEEVLKKL
ncbi:MAG: M1 family aminopeptidase [Ignavibacteria bacterium]|nr:M1 family aminopeptidase [Ignavibacteria bacterium]